MDQDMGAGETAGAGHPRVVLVGKAGCHLCDEARAVVRAVCAAEGVEWVEVSILDDPELADRYAEQIPVVLVDGALHGYWHLDAGRLSAALAAP